MQTKALKTLIRIAEVESFAIAANQLGMTLSALSMQIKTLEQELETNLFDRSYRPPKLTPIGRRIAEQAVLVIEAENALRETSNPDQALTGTYRIGFVATASVRLLPSFLKNAAAKVPEVHFDLETGLSETFEDKLLSGQLDAAVLTASGDMLPTLQYDVLQTEEMVYAVPKAFADTPLKALLQKLTFLQFNPSSGIGKLIANQISQLNDKRNRTIGLDSVEAIMECVNQQIGFTMLAEPDVRRYANTSVEIIRPKGKVISRQLVLASSNRGLSGPARKALFQLFQT